MEGNGGCVTSADVAKVKNRLSNAGLDSSPGCYALRNPGKSTSLHSVTTPVDLQKKRVGASLQSPLLKVTMKKQQNACANRRAFFFFPFLIHQSYYISMLYIHSVYVKKTRNLVLETVYLPTFVVSAAFLICFYHCVPFSDYLASKNLRVCLTENYHPCNFVSKTVETYEMEMKEKQR